MIARNLDKLHRQKVVYRRDPTEKPDFENNQYMFFENGTYQAYDLFKSKAKINTYKSLKWHLLVIWYLNPQMNPEEFDDLTKFIADDIYQCMIDMNDMGKKITIGRLAGLLDCSTRTIHRNMCDELRREKELLNRSI